MIRLRNFLRVTCKYDTKTTYLTDNDSNVYAVVHAAAAYLPWSTVEHEFVSQFKLGDAQTCLYMSNDLSQLIDEIVCY